MSARKKEKSTVPVITGSTVDIVPKKTVKNTANTFPIVGIGASAGGLAAFEAFFSGMPEEVEPGMAFVLVQHLAPNYKSILTEIISRFTSMKVFEVTDGMRVKPNCVYIIPPGYNMALLSGTLQLFDPSPLRGQRLPIDFFFRSLAADRHENAIGVILSGSGSDGTLGIRAIKGENGLVMVQTADSAEYDGMPKSVIATGLFDFNLPAPKMAAALISYAARLKKYSQTAQGDVVDSGDNALNKIFILLRSRTRHDFSGYKLSTINRRIARRIAVNRLDNIDAYVKYLQQTPTEIETLLRELLINVTSFFRDPEAFKALEQVIPKIFAGKPDNSVIRVWSAGCSTGEEAYSVAILMHEQMVKQQRDIRVQIFATDTAGDAIAAARAGIYPGNIAADITPDRLAQYFTAETGGAYRIHKNIRDLLVFSEQNIIRDPPFSKLDLIICRNVMIYMGRDLQKKLMDVFHYALNPGGLLFLGTSETANEAVELFTAFDQKSQLYQRKDDYQGMRTLSPMRLLPSEKAFTNPAALPMPPPPLRQLPPTQQHGSTAIKPVSVPPPPLWRKPPTQQHGSTAIKPVSVPAPELRIKTNAGDTVNLSIPNNDAGQYRLSPESSAVGAIVNAEPGGGTAVQNISLSVGANTGYVDTAAQIAALEQEILVKDEFIQTSGEEFKSSNEEMQSVNEELQSANEELETAKEEMQSINEELSTVNAELQNNISELTRTNNDMNNLLAGTNIATVFVDNQLCLKRFTPAATIIINLITSDIGRPIAHSVLNITGYNSLAADTQHVLDTLIPIEREVQTNNGKWFMMRIQPYRTCNNVIEGATITFFDITETVRMREELDKTNTLSRLAVVLHDARDAITVQNLDGRIIAWNPSAAKIYGWSETEALAMNASDRIPAQLYEEELNKIRQLMNGELLELFPSQRICRSGKIINVAVIYTALVNQDGLMYAVATTERAKDV